MRSGILISAALHVVLVAALLSTTPRRFDPVVEQVEEVELVPEKDAPKPPEQKEEPKPEKPDVWNFPDEKPKFDLPRMDVGEHGSNKTPSTPQAATKAKQKAEPKQQAEATVSQQPAPSASSQQQQQQQQQSQQSPSQPAQSPGNSQQAALTPSGSPPQTSGFASEPKPGGSIFDPANIPRLMDLPVSQSNGFDSESTVQANLTSDERTAFKEHLRKCWKAPGNLAPATRVVLRVSLRPNGALASEPMLIEASASRDGPAVLEAATRALKACQPFGFLPAEKYKEWKVLDLSFTPRDMAGG
ncbi:MAG: hypothetical protein JO000_04045 [Alphaproteobacteria bacterium]|nr:hypothetical protein [Alphaproteobacteria bacterium]